MPKLWQTRSATFFLAAFAAASVGFWVLQWPQPSHPPRALALDAALVTTDATKVASLLGATPQGTSQPPGVLANVSSRFKLWGVIAQSQHGHPGASGSALIAVDGAPAKPYRVGQQVADDLTLLSVLAHSVTLGPKGQSAASITLELPAPPGVITPKPAQ
ncbi:MAG: general secretion pathway protein C [Comamonadaceae bacterium CG12_big_fil_rev_8_21_14_0_65_59_15]|nr:MAG: general secretion pathway protein C [Comamonadaceae bacterium CG12_big_fil_rev_8_21_14_0_65_59_15]